MHMVVYVLPNLGVSKFLHRYHGHRFWKHGLESELSDCHRVHKLPNKSFLFISRMKTPLPTCKGLWELEVKCLVNTRYAVSTLKRAR